jgi:signal peptidase II
MADAVQEDGVIKGPLPPLRGTLSNGEGEVSLPSAEGGAKRRERSLPFLWGIFSRIALLCAMAAFLIDQATKWFLVALVDLDDAGTWYVTPFFSLTMAWNEGISYSLFAGYKQGFLIALSLGVTAMLWTWTATAETTLKAAALGLIIGGALGNVFDRAWHGAVADFLDFHIGGWNWYIFNFADVFITVGVAALVYESFTIKTQK